MDIDDISATLEIMKRFARYGQIFDHKELDNVDELLDLFTDNCTLDYDFAGQYDNKAEFREFAESYIGGESSNTDWFHQFTNPWIDVDGNEARGRWNFVGYYVFEDVGATWMVGFYDIYFVEVAPDDWRIDDLTLEFKYASPISDGWAETPIADAVRY